MFLEKSEFNTYELVTADKVVNLSTADPLKSTAS